MEYGVGQGEVPEYFMRISETVNCAGFMNLYSDILQIKFKFRPKPLYKYSQSRK